MAASAQLAPQSQQPAGSDPTAGVHMLHHRLKQAGARAAAAVVKSTSVPGNEVLQLLALSTVAPEPVAQLAMMLQAFWALPQQAAAAALELGQALGARSCANLRCPNLEGGAAGLESRACAGCRCVRFCSQECACAAWRAWHRHSCAALAAARAAHGG